MQNILSMALYVCVWAVCVLTVWASIRDPVFIWDLVFIRSLHYNAFNIPIVLLLLLLLLLVRLFVTHKIPSRRLQMHCPAVRKCSCLYTMYHINNNVFSCVLKVVRLQSNIRNAVGKLFHTEGPETAKQ